MKVVITPAQRANPAALCGSLSAAGLHNVTVTAMSEKRLEVTCEDDDFKQVVAAVAHDGRIKAAVICAKDISGRIESLTFHACQ